MRYFTELGESIQSEWSQADYDIHALPAIAHAALMRRPPSNEFDAETLATTFLSQQRVPPQPNLDSSFGEPPLTVFWAPRFFIEALYWRDGTTAIHQHSFSGAFAVLEGGSIQCRYTFEPERDFGHDLCSGRLELQSVDLLQRGDAHRIDAGGRLLHSVFHLQSPSVTIVVRTPARAELTPQYSYRLPGIRENRNIVNPAGKRTRQLLGYLRETNSARYEETAAQVIPRLDTLSLFRLLIQERIALADDRFAQLVSHAERGRRDAIAALLPAVEDAYRQAVLINERAKLREEEHRFFLAAMLNMPHRHALLELVQRRFPLVAPNQTVRRWLEEIGDREVFGVAFDEVHRELFNGLVDGASIDVVATRLISAGYDPSDVAAQREELSEQYQRMARLPAFATVNRQRHGDAVG